MTQINEIATLVWEENGSTKTYAIQKREILIGRSRSCDLVLEQNSVSRKHAVVFSENGAFYLKDLGSSYGSKINQEPVAADKDHPLQSGDLLQVGKIRFRFKISGVDGDSEEERQIKPPARFSSIKLREMAEQFRSRVEGAIDDELSQTDKGKHLQKTFHQEMADFERYVQGKLREQEVLQEINQQIGKILDVKELLSTALRLVTRVLNADRGFILLYDHKLGRMKTMVPHRFDPRHHGALYDFTFSNTIALGCFKERQIHFIEDAMEDSRFKSKQSILASSIRSVVCIPLSQGEDVHGVIYLDNLRKPGIFHNHQIDFLRAFSLQTTIALKNAQLYTQAVTDDLTKLYNRKFVDQRILEEMERSQRYERPCSLLLIDIDYFKKVNDTHGHLAGDQVLSEVAALIKREARTTDIVGRYGGEEFLLLLPETGQNGSVVFADRLRTELAKLAIEVGATSISVTMSIGIACYQASMETNVSMFVDRADKAMYQAKNEGRDRVCIADSVGGEAY